MNDASPQEIPAEELKSEPRKSPEPLAKRINPLGMLEPDYNELPGSFEVGEEFIEAINLLCHRTETEKVEVGGILTKDKEGKLRFKTAGRCDSGVFTLDMVEITDENLSWFTEGSILTSRDGKPTKDIIFVSRKNADSNSQYFKTLIDMGTEVVLDRVPVGILHSHPSGNLPSPGDFSHTVIYSKIVSSTKIPEIVVTSEYTYLLFPTKQTVELTDDQIKGMDEWIKEEDETERYLTEKDKTNGIINPDIKGHTNAFRYNFLRTHCLEHNVGFYALKNEDKTAQRVF